jgi:hypothetical protein
VRTISTRGIVQVRWLALGLLFAGCERGFDDEPLDGGGRLQPITNYADTDGILANDPCWRRERGGWHFSIQHCAEMLAPRRMTGVWIRGFEVSHFHPGVVSIADVDDPRQDRFSLEVDEAKVVDMIGRQLEGPDLHAVALTFVGRRTRVPWVDCYRGRDWQIVVDRIEHARYLEIPDDFPMGFEPPETYPPSPEGTVIRRLEDEALAGCESRRRG